MKRLALASLVIACVSSSPVIAQERGAAALGHEVEGLGVSARVLMIGAHPDDEDTRLIAFLARGRHVGTAYLSLTRGDGGQNLIGNELGEALGVIRTEELLAARRVDGAHQYFTRAYDFGFSKSAEEAFTHWPHDTLLGDVVRVVRAFRPQVIVSVFGGTPRDGHGQHQVAGILAREAYDLAGDTVRFPVRQYGPAWTPAKFYRTSTYFGQGWTLRFNVGEYDPLAGRSYNEIAGESRSQHRSQAMGQLERKGVAWASVRREATRVNESTPAEQERTLFDGIDTTWARLKPLVSDPVSAAALDSSRASLARARDQIDLRDPARSVPALSTIFRQLDVARETAGNPLRPRPPLDVTQSLDDAHARAATALLDAAGIAIEATTERDAMAIGDSAKLTVTVFNRGTSKVTVRRVDVYGPGVAEEGLGTQATVAPDSAATWSLAVHGTAVTQPWWLSRPRQGDMFATPLNGDREDSPWRTLTARVIFEFAGRALPAFAPIVNRVADPSRGEVDRPLAVVPRIAVTLDRTLELAQANAPLDRTLRVTVRSAETTPCEVRVSLELPKGLVADTVVRTVTLPQFDAQRTVEFRVVGNLPAGRHTIRAVAESGGARYTLGYVPIEYEHIRPQKLYRQAETQIEAVDVKLPAGVTVAYIPGVGDNVAPVLQQLGLPVTVIEPEKLAHADLSQFGTVVVGTRAYEASPELAAQNAKLLDYARSGGTLVVQYGQYEMEQPGMMPYPIKLARPADRVTDERAPVRVLKPNDPLLTAPNRITDADWEGWVQDRTYYMPRTHAPEYVPLLSTNDPGESPNDGAILVAPYGRGTYVYTTLAFFRQLPAGNAGATRLFVNLLGAGQAKRASARAVP